MGKHQQPRRPKKSLLITGRAPIIHAMEKGEPLEKIYIDKRIPPALFHVLKSTARKYYVPVRTVPPFKMNSFNMDIQEGCVAICSKIRYHELQNVISYIHERGESPLLLLLDGITDIRNIGGIARSAFCMGVQAIIIPENGVGALNQDALDASAGALEKLMVCRVDSLMKAVDELHLNGIRVFAADGKAKKKLDEVDLKEPAAIVMGSEDKGIYPALSKICDAQLKISMSGDFDSLNVSVAAGIILYEVMKQRRG